MSLNVCASATTIGTAADLGAPPRRQRVVLPHGFGEMLERSERRTQQDQIGGQQRDQADGEHEQFARPDRHRDGDGREHQAGEGEHEDARVRGEHAPEQRNRSHATTHEQKLRKAVYASACCRPRMHARPH